MQKQWHEYYAKPCKSNVTNIDGNAEPDFSFNNAKTIQKQFRERVQQVAKICYNDSKRCYTQYEITLH